MGAAIQVCQNGLGFFAVLEARLALALGYCRPRGSITIGLKKVNVSCGSKATV
jgi:hypothetical protein